MLLSLSIIVRPPGTVLKIDYARLAQMVSLEMIAAAAKAPTPEQGPPGPPGMKAPSTKDAPSVRKRKREHKNTGGALKLLEKEIQSE
jgi:hypothetical protein